MRNLRYLISFFLFLLAGAVILSIKFSYIGSDAPYYLSVARDISEGLVPYRDIYLSYTPLVMYFNAVVFNFFTEFQYAIFLFLQYVVILSGGVLLYVANTKHIRLEKMKASLLSTFFILAVLSSDGDDVILEVYSVVCVLFGLIFFFKKSLFWTGFFLGLSFFCKQFGLLNFIPFYLFLVLMNKERYRRLMSLSLGGLVPLLIFLLYFTVFKNVSTISLFNQLNGAAYTSRSLVSPGSFLSYIVGIKVFALLLVPLVFFRKNVLHDQLNIFLISGVVVNLFPLLLQGFQHYYINTFPFLFVLIGRVWKQNKDRIIIYHSFCIFFITTFFYLRVFRYSELQETQKEVAKYTDNILSQNSTVFLYGNIRYLYLLNNYKNPFVSTIGYSYPYKPDKKAMGNINVLSVSKLNGIHQEVVKIGGRSFYIYVGSPDKLKEL